MLVVKSLHPSLQEHARGDSVWAVTGPSSTGQQTQRAHVTSRYANPAAEACRGGALAGLVSSWTELTCYSLFNLIQLPAWDTRRRPAEHAAPRQACRASLNCLHVSGLPRALVTRRPSRPVGSCTSSRNNNKHTSSTRRDCECVRLGVRMSGTHRLVSYLRLSCWW